MPLFWRVVLSDDVVWYRYPVGTEDTSVAAAAYCPWSTSTRALPTVARVSCDDADSLLAMAAFATAIAVSNFADALASMSVVELGAAYRTVPSSFSVSNGTPPQ